MDLKDVTNITPHKAVCFVKQLNYFQFYSTESPAVLAERISRVSLNLNTFTSEIFCE
jgi:hypothetical protein